ncbi:alpha/beta hydrolase [Nocardioides sp.]|uniref:alpha/beta fold hydrolase n=1 Tax=Nocardioides sp. TaxID=35761 RepID=UPI002B277935|nr:alpha/beta hydrolase [Nocardioides sp.]
MTYRTVGRYAARAGRVTARLTGRVVAHGLRKVGDGAVPDVPVPPPGRAVDLPGRGRTHVLDLPGPTPGAPTVLLMHGIATTGGLTWFTVLEDLRRHYRVVTFDQRWHGRGISSDAFTLDDCADDAVGVLDALEIDAAIVVGYSMGGASAQVLWHRHPERVAGLVLCSTAARWKGHLGERVFFLMLRAVNAGLLSVAAEKVRAHSEAALPQSDEADLAGLLAWCLAELRATSLWSLPVVMAELGSFDSTSWIKDVDVPTGVLVTARDRAIPTARQRRLADRIPHAIVRESPGGHASLVFDLDHWKPVFLALVDDVVEAATRQAPFVQSAEG